ncbi:MFS transporter [Macrococcus hajekii]|uniref:MFS transporter n=1 Tax=Macrococcus hajekii TaxID=198482 RepID=A0A4R6BJE4_9STAP|nr:MFS transporter [Macrococcus hajekii]TDM01740.1 MFS transporter [Macrococcus hajekii]GGB07006.1 hypothetical protein GCM10007190_13830 [Macrococcus hajekii]
MKKLSINFKYLYFSQLFANAGDILYIVALIGYVYEHTHSAQASIYVPIIITAAVFLSGWFVPYVYSRWSKKEILLFNQTAKTFLMVVILICVVLTEQIYSLYLLAFFNAFLDGFTNPLKMALIPLTEQNDHIGFANAQMSMMSGIVQIGSWSLGGILLLLGSERVIVITIVLYISSVMLISRLNLHQDILETEQTSIFRSFNKMVTTNRLLQESHFLNMSTLFESIGHSVWLAAILLVFIAERLHANTSWFSFINALFFLGVVVGGVLLTKFNDTLMNYSRLYIVSIPLALALLNILFVYNEFLFVTLAISFIFGICDELRATLMHTQIQMRLDDYSLTALYTLNGMIYSLCFCVSSYLIGTIADYSVVTAFIIAACAYIICFLISIKYRKLFK